MGSLLPGWVGPWRDDELAEMRATVAAGRDFDGGYTSLGCWLSTLSRVRREAVEECARKAETFYPPCDEPADLSARACGENIALAIRQLAPGAGKG